MLIQEVFRGGCGATSLVPMLLRTSSFRGSQLINSSGGRCLRTEVFTFGPHRMPIILLGLGRSTLSASCGRNVALAIRIHFIRALFEWHAFCIWPRSHMLMQICMLHFLLKILQAKDKKCVSSVKIHEKMSRAHENPNSIKQAHEHNYASFSLLCQSFQKCHILYDSIEFEVRTRFVVSGWAKISHS